MRPLHTLLLLGCFLCALLAIYDRWNTTPQSCAFSLPLMMMMFIGTETLVTQLVREISILIDTVTHDCMYISSFLCFLSSLSLLPSGQALLYTLRLTASQQTCNNNDPDTVTDTDSHQTPTSVDCDTTEGRDARGEKGREFGGEVTREVQEGHAYPHKHAATTLEAEATSQYGVSLVPLRPRPLPLPPPTASPTTLTHTPFGAGVHVSAPPTPTPSPAHPTPTPTPAPSPLARGQRQDLLHGDSSRDTREMGSLQAGEVPVHGWNWDLFGLLGALNRVFQ